MKGSLEGKEKCRRLYVSNFLKNFHLYKGSDCYTFNDWSACTLLQNSSEYILLTNNKTNTALREYMHKDGLHAFKKEKVHKIANHTYRHCSLGLKKSLVSSRNKS